MAWNLKRKLVVGGTAIAVAAFAGGAYAANQQSPESARQAFLADVAHRLHVTPAQLKSAIDGALSDRLATAVKAGRLTQAQANALKQRLGAGGFGPFAYPPVGRLVQPPGFGPNRPLPFRRGWYVVPGGGPPPVTPAGGLFAVGAQAAARYLGLSDAQLFSQVRSGKSLAQIAKARGKSPAGLETAILAALRTQLAQAVAAKRLSTAQEQQILSRLTAMLTARINTPQAFAPRLPGGAASGRSGWRAYAPPPVPPAVLRPPAALPPPGA